MTELRASLRVSKQKQAVMGDALGELRTEFPATRDLLRALWRFLETKEIRVSSDLKTEYEALRSGDSLDAKPIFRGSGKKGAEGMFGGGVRRGSQSGVAVTRQRRIARMFGGAPGAARDVQVGMEITAGEGARTDDHGNGVTTFLDAAVQFSKDAGKSGKERPPLRHSQERNAMLLRFLVLPPRRSSTRVTRRKRPKWSPRPLAKRQALRLRSRRLAK